MKRDKELINYCNKRTIEINKSELVKAAGCWKLFIYPNIYLSTLLSKLKREENRNRNRN